MLGIIIINYIKYELTLECIQSVFETIEAPHYKIYLLENGSQNESAEILAREYSNADKIDLIISHENLGYGRGNNLCLKKALADGCDTVIVSNNDILFHSGAISALCDELHKENCFITAPKVVTPSGSTQCTVKAEPYSFFEYLKYETYLRNFVSKEKLIQNSRLPKEKTNVYWACGAVFAADMKKFNEIGFFDPYTFLYFEEYILAEKAKQFDLSILFVPSAVIVHHHGASSGGNANLFTRMENLKSELYFLSEFWNYSYLKLSIVRFVRCLEVLFTFTKEKKFADACTFVRKSRRILSQQRKKQNEA